MVCTGRGLWIGGVFRAGMGVSKGGVEGRREVLCVNGWPERGYGYSGSMV